MKLLTKEIIKNTPKRYSQENVSDKTATAKFFDPCGSATWYMIELDEDKDIFFGYVTGLYEDEYGYSSISELESIKRPFGLTIERDIHFQPTKRISSKIFLSEKKFNSYNF